MSEITPDPEAVAETEAILADPDTLAALAEAEAEFGAPDEDEIDETVSDPDAPEADPGFTPDPDADDADDTDDGEPIVDEDVAEFIVGEDEDPAEVLALPEADRALAAARDLTGYSGATYDLIDEDGTVLDTFRADVPFGFELAEGQSLVPSSV